MNRGNREKDFLSFSFVFSCRWSNEGFDHSFSRALSQLGSAPKRRGSCHAPGVSPGTVARCTAMEADHAKASAKIFFSTQGSAILQGSGAHPRLQRSFVRLTRRPKNGSRRRMVAKDARDRGILNHFGILRSPPKAASPFRAPAPIHVFKGAFVRLGPPLRLRRAT